jgi:urease accessory protein
MTPYRIWQLVDSAFPAGGFAHSGGLEAAFRLAALAGDGELERYLIQQIEQAGSLLLPFVVAAHNEPARVRDFDWSCDAAITGHVPNRASRAQGRAWIAATRAAFGSVTLHGLYEACRAGELAGHFAPMFGVALSIVEVSRDEAERLFLYQQARSVLSSAVRLNVAGPMEAQALLARLGPVLESTWGRCRTIQIDDAAQSAPLLDLWQGHHDRLYSRLFSS